MLNRLDLSAEEKSMEETIVIRDEDMPSKQLEEEYQSIGAEMK